MDRKYVDIQHVLTEPDYGDPAGRKLVARVWSEHHAPDDPRRDGLIDMYYVTRNGWRRIYDDQGLPAGVTDDDWENLEYTIHRQLADTSRVGYVADRVAGRSDVGMQLRCGGGGRIQHHEQHRTVHDRHVRVRSVSFSCGHGAKVAGQTYR